jgi:hypothetical protein
MAVAWRQKKYNVKCDDWTTKKSYSTSHVRSAVWNIAKRKKQRVSKCVKAFGVEGISYLLPAHCASSSLHYTSYFFLTKMFHARSYASRLRGLLQKNTSMHTCAWSDLPISNLRSNGEWYVSCHTKAIVLAEIWKTPSCCFHVRRSRNWLSLAACSKISALLHQNFTGLLYTKQCL